MVINPNSRGLYTYSKDSLLKVGWVYPQYREFRPQHIWCQSAKVHMHTCSASTRARTSGSRSTSRDSAFRKHPTLKLIQVNIATIQTINTQTHIYVNIYIYIHIFKIIQPLIETKTLVWWLVETFFRGNCSSSAWNQRCLGPSFC